jgi:type IV secretory pathway TraG/TraD family ATPase VirD4
MERYKRGARVEAGWRGWSRKPLSGSWSGAQTLGLAGVAMTSADETKHFKIIGTTGTGKSTAITELLNGALSRGDRVIVADPDGGYLARFYERRRGDVILNPFDARSVKWDPFAEVHTAYDVEQLASGLIPSSEDASSHEWRGYARTFLAAVADRCRRVRESDVAELWRLLAIASTDEVRKVVAGTAAQPFLETDNARMFGSIRSITGSAVAALTYIQAQRAPSFSVRNWVRTGTGSLFVPYRASQIAALRSIIATWLRLAIFEAMARPEQDLHLWFVMDELDALGAVDGLKDALVRLRKYGGRCVIGFQSIAQVSGTYGTSDAQTIVENCGNTLILRCSGSDEGGTSRFASRLIGEREIVRRQTARGRDRDGTFFSNGSRRSIQVSEQHIIEPAVMPSELEQLPDLTGFLKTASSPAWRRVRLARPR